ncbi:AI-2E family transporter [Leucobacter sp. UCMA 4100]|uniref:AI-2E family transporter n=1 Tax=Leucobacter sp. UCMA 4100 TaxID=2810534 RepID=UPI0022EA9120|nr:AI-2E family transporter [Leucobacter sp. UCMA 4100]
MSNSWAKEGGDGVAETPSEPVTVQVGGASKLRSFGLTSWALVGVIVLTVLIAGAMSALSGILVPLTIAVILGAVLEPLVGWLCKTGLSRSLAATVVLLVTLTVLGGVVYVVVHGFIQQVPEISQQVLRGWHHIDQALRSAGLDASWIEPAREAAVDYLSQAGRGAVGFATSALYGAVTFAIGTFFATYFLFFVLRDGQMFPGWIARITHRDPVLVTEIDAQVRTSLRAYFKGTAITALITGPIFVIPLLVLGIPLVVPMIILYFFLSFVPFIGAWLTGLFAVLIAFGYGGAPAALIVGIGLLISNGPIQNAVNAYVLGSSLKIHPVMVLLSTIVGGVVAGVIGMVLGPPLVAAVQRALAAVRDYRDGLLAQAPQES